LVRFEGLSRRSSWLLLVTEKQLPSHEVG